MIEPVSREFGCFSDCRDFSLTAYVVVDYLQVKNPINAVNR